MGRDPHKAHTTSFAHSGHSYYLDFQDQPGHMSMNSRPSFLSSSFVNVILMCFAVDNLESLKDLQYVMEPLLNSSYLGIPALLVGCKSDLRLTYARSSHHSLVAKDQAQATQAVLRAVNYLESSAATPGNITEVLTRIAHWAMQHQAYVSGLSKSRRLFLRASISRFNVQQTREQILEHRCDFRQWAPG